MHVYRPGWSRDPRGATVGFCGPVLPGFELQLEEDLEPALVARPPRRLSLRLPCKKHLSPSETLAKLFVEGSASTVVWTGPSSYA